MPDDWELSDDEIVSRLEEWKALDRAVAEYLAQRIPMVQDIGAKDRGRWLYRLTETISPLRTPARKRSSPSQPWSTDDVGGCGS